MLVAISDSQNENSSLHGMIKVNVKGIKIVFTVNSKYLIKFIVCERDIFHH